MTEILPLWADALDQKGGSLLSRAEKVIMIILSGLGAGYWGYGLLLYLTIPGEYKYWFGMEMGFGVGLFLLFEVAILKNGSIGDLPLGYFFYSDHSRDWTALFNRSLVSA